MQGIWHVSFTVSNLARAVSFYQQLGMELVHEQIQDNAYTRRLVGVPDARLQVAQLCAPGSTPGPSGHHLELVQYLQPQAEAGDLAVYRPGTAHLAFVVGDVHAEYRRLDRLGVLFVSPPNLIEAGVNAGGWTCYFRDPDGITLELVQPPEHDGTATQ